MEKDCVVLIFVPFQMEIPSDEESEETKNCYRNRLGHHICGK